MIFDINKKLGPQGREFWYLSDFQTALGITNNVDFETILGQAIETCKASGYEQTKRLKQHFFPCKRTINVDNVEKEVWDFILSRYGCYLIAREGDPFDKNIRLARAYYARMSRGQELTPEAFDELEARKRLLLRRNVADGNILLNDGAKSAGINSEGPYRDFHNAGYFGLYDGRNTQAIRECMGLSKKANIADHMSSEALAANLTRITLATKDMQRMGPALRAVSRDTINDMHYKAGSAVRLSIHKTGGALPEFMPTAEKNIQQIERQYK